MTNSALWAGASRAVRVGCGLALAAAATAGCTATTANHSAGGSSTPSNVSAAGAQTGHRWWSNSAAGVGSTIDPNNPAAAAAHLAASSAEYCGMLRQTVAAGKSVLSNVTANDPELTTSVRAFVAELEAVAPAPIAGSWRVLGPAVLTFVESGGDTTKVKTVDAAAVRQAASTVAADAKRSCGVDLSLSAPGGG